MKRSVSEGKCSNGFKTGSPNEDRVVVDGKFSEWVEVLSSVIHGSVLGVILFDIFVGDIDEAIIMAIIKKFAGDTKLAIIVKNADER